MPRITVNDTDFYYETHGSGHPVIFIAGYSCDHTTWLPILDKMSKHFKVMLFDNRGVGQTQDDNSPLSIEKMAQDVMALSAQLGFEKPHIVGQSMGGCIAQTVAINHSDKIGKLCLLTTSAKWRTAMRYGFQSLLNMREDAISFDLIFDATQPWIFGEAFLQNTNNLTQLKKAMLNNLYPQTLQDQKRQFAMIEKFDTRNQLSNITSATLVAYGIQDIVSLPSDSHFIANNIPHAQLVEFDCAHGIMFEQPVKLAQTLISFLKANND